MTVDWAQIRTDLLAVRDSNAVSLVLRRGSTTLTAQTVRVERLGLQSRQAGSAAGQQNTTGVVVMGDTTLDIQIGDRFTSSSVLYEVKFVRPNRRAATMAEAQAVE